MHTTKTFPSNHLVWLLPIVLLLCVTPFISSWDLQIAELAHKEQGLFKAHFFYDCIYHYGVMPAQVTFLLALVAFLASFLFSKCRHWRRGALLLILPLLIGGGGIVHLILKDHWGRPRPKQVYEFGGNHSFFPYYQPNLKDRSEPMKSFSCGHCTMGFYFFSMIFLGKYLKSRTLFWGGIALTIILGFLLSLARIAQEGHFLSDILVSALIMWLSTYACFWFLYRNDIYERTDEKTTRNS